MSNTPKPILFLAFANDRADDTRYLRNLPEEARRLQTILDQAQKDGLCEVVVRQNATIDTILDVFRERDYRNRIALFHFAGHANGYQLLLETADGKAATVDAGGLAAFLGQQQGLEVVFLNGCSTQNQVQGLLDASGSAVIATSQAIDDTVATEFAVHFYTGLAGGLAIGQAFAEAEAAVQTVRGGVSRHLYDADVQDMLFDDRWPWELVERPGAESAGAWNLPDAADDPLFGLPPLPELDLPASPYRHLNWYRREDAEVFFGRGREIRDLYERVADPVAAPIILFYGQSGVGKSSLLAAGLLPRLENSQDIRYLRRDQSLGLLGTLQAELGEDIAAGWQQVEAQGQPLTIILDQVEERYTRPRPDDAAELATLLAVLQDVFAVRDQRPLGKLVLAFRKEWLAEIEKQIAERKLPRSKVFLQRLDRRGVMEVVTGPTSTERLRQHYGMTVVENLPQLIADDLLSDRGSSVAPTLQILLSKMWAEAKEQSYDEPLFDDDLYHELKSQGLGLGDFLDQQLAVLREDMPAAVESGLALDLLAYHTTPLGTAEQRSQSELQETYEHQKEVLPDLVQHSQRLYLLVDPAANHPEKPPASRLAHDSLAPIVRQCFDNSEAVGQVAHRVLHNRVKEYRSEQGGPLLDEWALEQIEDGQAGMRTLTKEEDALVDASRKMAEASKIPELTEDIFPSSLRIRKFAPEKLLSVYFLISLPDALLHVFLAWIFCISISAIVVLMMSSGSPELEIPKAYFYPLFLLGPIILSYLIIRRSFITFDFVDNKVKRVQYVSIYSEKLDRSISYHIKPMYGGYRGELKYSMYTIVRTQVMACEEEVEKELMLFGRALNHEMGFSHSLSSPRKDETGSQG